MNRFFVFITIFFIPYYIYSNPTTHDDHSWWNELHGWEEGDPGWRNWMKISPGYLGPNALPIPSTQKGEIIGILPEIELTFSNHILKGDPTKDISGRIFIPFASNRIAIEMYGVIIERYSFSKKIRDERIARDKEGKGIANGDFYFSTHLQIIRNHKLFPNTLFRFGTKTASGNQLQAARYADSPAYFFDLSFSKNINSKYITLKPYTMIGFYSWQTNDELNLQNDALLYGLGLDIIKNTFLISSSVSGYSGYKDERDRPIKLTFDLRKDFKNTAIRFQYLHGIRDWKYQTLRLSFILKLNHAI